MELNQVVRLALSISIVTTVFGFGLRATSADLLYLLHRPALFARALLGIFVIMPLVAVTLVRLFDFSRTVEIVLVALAISPVPPLLPRRQDQARGEPSFGLGLMALLALASIVVVPVSLRLLALASARPLAMAPAGVAGVMIKATLAPLAAGMAVHALFPAAALRLGPVVTRAERILLPLAIALLLVTTASAIWIVATSTTVAAMLIFIVAGLVVGHALGGSDRKHAVVLALATACRHPAIALGIAATNFPDLQFGGTILLYVLMNVAVGLPYMAWQIRRAAGSTPPPVSV